tara:strand:- start:214 stop:624 length:411 start_codon:yes stop_codon:yes gene_type:complete
MHLKKSKRPNKTLEMVNLIPMINLIFLLLIFFLLTGVISKKDSNDISRPESEFGNEVEIDNQSIVFAINKNDEILYENKSLNIEELSKFIQSKNKKYILDLDKESSIYFFNRIMKEFKVKDIKKVFVKVIEKENDK